MAVVGFIGLGTMGTPMARRLVDAGHRVTVWARRAEAMAPLVSAGALPGESPEHAASGAEAVFTMVTDTRAVEDVVLGANGIVHGASPGAIVVDHSTIVPDGSRRMAHALRARGIEMLDAPVSGGRAAAAAGTLAIMAGGSRAAFDRVEPLLRCYGTSVAYVGPSGSGQVAKACNQICTIVNQLGAAEAMLLAERAGVDPGVVRDVIMSGFGASRMLDLQAPKMIARDFEGKIESRLHHKDVHIVLDLARAFGIELPASAAAAGVLDRLQARGGARRDSSAIFAVLDDGGGM